MFYRSKAETFSAGNHPEISSTTFIAAGEGTGVFGQTET